MATLRRSTRLTSNRRPLSDLSNYKEEKSDSSIGSSFAPNQAHKGDTFCSIREEDVQSKDRRKGKGKRKANLEQSMNISAPIKQIKNTRQQEDDGEILPLVAAQNCRGKKKPSPKVSNNNLISNEDYFEKQRAYFAEIDAYELEVEYISDTGLG